TLDAFAGRTHPQDHDRVMDAVFDHIRRHVPYDVEFRLQTKAGDYRWFHARGQAIWDERGEATRMAGSMGDITERKRWEAQLREQNERLQEMARSERMAHEDLKRAQSQM